LTNPKANQHPKGKKKKCNKKGKGNKKDNSNVGGVKTKKKNLKYLCNLFMEDNLTDLFPRIVEAQNLLAQQQPIVLTNPFTHGKNMAQASVSSRMEGGSQGPPAYTSNTSATNVYMLKGDAHIATISRDYNMLEYVEKGKKSTNSPFPL
jgi:hypothetical protein